MTLESETVPPVEAILPSPSPDSESVPTMSPATRLRLGPVLRAEEALAIMREGPPRAWALRELAQRIGSKLGDESNTSAAIRKGFERMDGAPVHLYRVKNKFMVELINPGALRETEDAAQDERTRGMNPFTTKTTPLEWANRILYLERELALAHHAYREAMITWMTNGDLTAAQRAVAAGSTV